MTVTDWASRLCDELSKNMVQEVESYPASSRFERVTRAPEARPGQGGCIHVDLVRYGLHIMQDESEVLVWLLDATGRTNGPIWCGEMTAQRTSAAAAEIARVVKEAPSADSFRAWPPTHRDVALEDAVNALWRVVQMKIDEIQAASVGEAGIEDAVESVEFYIDELARLEVNAGIAEYAMPFKAKAADVIRDRAKAAASERHPG
jgi:hypothetical protein